MPHPLLATREVRALQERAEKNRVKLVLAREIQNGIQMEASRGGEYAQVNIYQGKKGVSIVIQGSEGLKSELLAEADSPWSIWIGSDESGKGDFFGPLVVAAVRVDVESARELRLLGVRDCKVLSDARVAVLDPQIRKRCVFGLVRLDPPEYNKRYAQERNLNAILGWGHAAAIEQVIAQRDDPEAALADQFGRESYIRDRLKKKITLIQRPRAESDPAVAAASVVARAEFLRALDDLSRAHGADLPKGAGEDVVAAAKRFAAAHGKKTLANVAKMHFKTLDRI